MSLFHPGILYIMVLSLDAAAAFRWNINKMKRLTCTWACASVLLSLLGWNTFAQQPNGPGPIRLTLQNSFIEQLADRGTIDTTFTIDHAHAKPNSPAKDGDMHIAGRAPEIGLPCVAELMNARFESDELKIVKKHSGTGETVRVTGAWRLWAEHADPVPQIQKLGTIGSGPFPGGTNPPHLFEIHPVLSMNDESSATGWVPIEGFKTKDAHDAFTRYENIRCKITPKSGGNTEIRTSMAGYNYVEFKLELDDDENGHEMQDGSRSYFCKTRDLDGDLLVRKVRAVFIKETEPFDVVKQAPKHKVLHVLGIPRISLALVKWRVEKSKEDPADEDFQDVLEWNLPYEMIIVGVYDEN